MSLTIEEVRYIANLARLELTDDELMRYRGQLSAILDYFQQLESLDTDLVPPTASVSSEHTPLRIDNSRPGLTRTELLDNAPKSDGPLFRVPPVFE
jgi:aspartyl-tRNA(Asn)/glutamyl-tRNA(Gln) amidotransferase subunit C